MILAVLLALALISVGICLWRERGKTGALERENEAALERLRQEAKEEESAHNRLVEWIDRIQHLKTSPSGWVPRRELSDTLVDAAAALTQSKQVVLWLQDTSTLELVPTASRGMAPEYLRRLKISPGQGTLGRAALEAGLVFGTRLDDLSLDAPFLAVPLRFDLRPYGLLVMSNPAGGTFPESIRQAVRLLSEQAILLLGNHALSAELRDAQNQAAEVLGMALEAKDPGTFAHSQRTRTLARTVAAELHLPERWVEIISCGALLHDIGKLGIPGSILNKPGPLSTEEYACIKKHSGIGARILIAAPYLGPASSVALYHHEWFNGQGYPEGLAGQEIPLSARLVQIVDAWDAMTTDRPYRTALSKTAAMAELRRFAGTQFDPHLVDVFLKVIDRLERESVPTPA